MELIVAARFDTFESAEHAAAALFEKGYAEDAVDVFFVGSDGPHDQGPDQRGPSEDPDAKDAQYGAIAGAAVVGLVGALIGVGIAVALTESLIPIVGGAAAGAYIGSLWGAVWLLGHRQRRRGRAAEDQQARPSGVLLAVRANPGSQKDVAGLLRAAGGTNVERARGKWSNGKWVDFDPLAPIVPEISS